MTAQSTMPSAVDTWRKVIALLVTAADRGYNEARLDPASNSTALWAHGIASTAISLLPPEFDHKLNDFNLDDQATLEDMSGLIRAAETETRRHPIEEFPPGASGVVAELCDLSAGLVQ